mmetsp:Transcript_45087/g.107154  ORF Transcript_45087/g.107154 Transcript_45087/m.107154 type:complete len:201 (-) Transcript_45087:712-1314(-)
MANVSGLHSGRQRGQPKAVGCCRLCLQCLEGFHEGSLGTHWLRVGLHRCVVADTTQLQESASLDASLNALAEELAGLVAGEDFQGLVDAFELGIPQGLPLAPLRALGLAAGLGGVEELDVRLHLRLDVVVGLHCLGKHLLGLRLVGNVLAKHVLQSSELLRLGSHELLEVLVASGLSCSAGLQVGAEGAVHLLKDALDGE